MSKPHLAVKETAVSVVQKIRMGAGYLPGLGDHPGWSILAFLPLLGALAGFSRGNILAAAVGAAAMLAIFGPVFLVGCVARANMYIAHNDENMF